MIPTKREESVLWSKISAPLTLTQLETYKKDGLLFFPSLLNEIAQELLPACLVSATNLESISSRESFISEEKTTELRSIYNAHMLDSNFQALIHHPYFVSIARQILGFNVYIHQSHINYKKAFSGENFFWHQDFTFWRDEDGMPSPRAIGIIVFLDEVRPENGPIMYIAGSHLNYYSAIKQPRKLSANEAARHNYSSDTENHGLIDKKTIRNLSKNHKLLTPIGPPGSVIIYDCNLIHASSDNISPFNRCLYLMFYNSCENTLRTPTRPEYISSRNFTPLPISS